MKKQELIENLKDLRDSYPNNDRHDGVRQGLLIAIGAIQNLEEPKKVVIPKFVADWIEEMKQDKRPFYSVMSTLMNKTNHEWAIWKSANMNFSEIVAQAWLEGFTIVNEDGELWKPIENYEGLYEVSNKGNVRSLDRDVQYKKTDFTMKITGIDLKPNVLKKGYLQVGLSKSGKLKSMLVHRLVMNAFSPTTNENLQVNHIDGNKENNEVSNLEWVTAIENTNHAYDIGLRDNMIGNNRKLTEDEVLEIIGLYETGNYTQKELGNKYNVGRNTIGEILLGKTWGWLTGITNEVEKEQLYYVLNKHGQTLLVFIGGAVCLSSGYVLRDGNKDKYQLTEKQIKDYDERYWEFAVEVAE